MSLDTASVHKLVTQAMTGDEAAAVIEWLMTANADIEDGARVLRTWAERGETGAELAGVVRLLRSKAVGVPIDHSVCDLCGTGGSGLQRYNVSTTAAFILAAAGVPIAKHGNKGSRRPDGSFDLLETLGIPLTLSPEALGTLHQETGLCFLFARAHHPAVGAVVPYRKAAGCRSIFNLAGPLANPVDVSAQIIGTIDEQTARVVAEAIVDLGNSRALVVWGHPGIDEISISGDTGYLAVADGATTAGTLTDAPHPGLAPEALPSGDAEANAATFTRLLAGEETGALRDLVCINAGAALDLWHGRKPSLNGPGRAESEAVLADGRVQALFTHFRDRAQQLA